MFNFHATLAIAATVAHAINLRQEIVGGDPSTWAPQQTLSVDVDELAQVDLEYNNHRDNIDWMACYSQGAWCDPDEHAYSEEYQVSE